MSVENNILSIYGFQHKGGTAEDLASVNPLPLAREIVVESDTGKMKIGDGVHYWNELSYSTGSGGDSSGGNSEIIQRLAILEDYMGFSSGIYGTQENNLEYHDTNLGEFTPEISAKIRAGIFENLFPGNYHQFTDIPYNYEEDGEIISDIYSGIMRYMDLDFFFGFFGCNTHHIVVLPDKGLYQRPMYWEIDTTEGGYTATEMYKKGLKRAEAIFKACFGEEHLLSHKEFLVNAVTNGVSSGGVITDCLVELMDERMLFGSFQYDALKNNSSAIRIPLPNSYDQSNPMFAAIRQNSELRKARTVDNPQYTDTWDRLRNVVSSQKFSTVDTSGSASTKYYPSWKSGAVRPYALIY